MLCYRVRTTRTTEYVRHYARSTNNYAVCTMLKKKTTTPVTDARTNYNTSINNTATCQADDSEPFGLSLIHI